MSELRAVPRDWPRKCKVGEAGKGSDVVRTAKLSEETSTAVTCEVPVWWETCKTIMLTISSLRKVENKMLVTRIKLIQTYVGGNREP